LFDLLRRTKCMNGSTEDSLALWVHLRYYGIQEQVFGVSSSELIKQRASEAAEYIKEG